MSLKHMHILDIINNMDPYTEACNITKRNKILDNRKFTFTNNENNYDIICPFCKTVVGYNNLKTHTKGKKHRIGVTIWLNQHSTNYDHDNVLQIG